jgi:hypothetical protein
LAECCKGVVGCLQALSVGQEVEHISIGVGGTRGTSLGGQGSCGGRGGGGGWGVGVREGV